MSDYRWNAYDPQTVWGLVFSPGLDSELMKAPKLKANGLDMDWADQNGTQRYHGTKRFATRILNIQCTLLATSESNVLSRYESLCEFLITNGEFNFDIVSRNRRFKVSYLDMPSFDKLNMWKGNSNIGVRLTIQLADDHPVTKFTIS